MSGFLIGVVLLLVVTLVIVLRPLWRGAQANKLTQQQLNSAIYRDQFAELERDRESGVLSETDYHQAKLELQARLLEDSSNDSGAQAAAPSSYRNLAAALAVFLPILSLTLYLNMGEPKALNADTPHQQRFAKDDIERMVSDFAAKLEKEPDNYRGWAMLARSYKTMGRFPEAIRAYERTGPMLETSGEMLVDYADAVASVAKRFDEKSLTLLNRALKLEPDNLQGLWMRGSAAFEEAKYDKAIADWERLLALLPPGSEEVEAIRGNIAEARSLGGKSAPGSKTKAPLAGPRIEGRVELAPAVADKLAPGDVLMVLAKSGDGNPVPAAVLKVSAKKFPMSFVLDDSLAVTEDQKISKHKNLLVEARISKSGQAMPKPGDLYGKGVPAKPGEKGLVLTVDQVR